jgi:hypothetical protein
MSSVVRSYGAVEAKTKFVPVKSLSYHNIVTNHTVLVPFTYSNGVLGLSTTTPGFTYEHSIDTNGYSWRMVKPMGVEGVVNALDESFTQWFEYYEEADNGSTTIQVAPVVTKVQMSVPHGGSILNSQYCYRSGLTEPPTSSEFVTGSAATNYDTVYVFKTPLVLRYTDSGNARYASIYTQFTNPS